MNTVHLFIEFWFFTTLSSETCIQSNIKRTWHSIFSCIHPNIYRAKDSKDRPAFPEGNFKKYIFFDFTIFFSLNFYSNFVISRVFFLFFIRDYNSFHSCSGNGTRESKRTARKLINLNQSILMHCALEELRVLHASFWSHNLSKKRDSQGGNSINLN